MTNYPSFRLLALSLCFLGLLSCASSIPLPNTPAFQNGMPFSQESFQSGEFRFSKGGWPFGDGGVSEAIHEGRYSEALNSLSVADMASDKSYRDLGLIAERMGHYKAASIYYGLAASLFSNQQLSLCKRQREITDPENPLVFQGLAVSTCFGLTLDKIKAAQIRTAAKADGSWEDTIIEYQNGTVYIGSVDDYGRPQGLGEMISKDGSFYFGDFYAGEKSGVGTMKIQLESNDLFFVGTFAKGKPDLGTLYNPSISTMGVKFAKVMKYRRGGFRYFNGDPLGSKPADNNYWFSGSWGETLGAAIRQGSVMYYMDQSPLFAKDDPLIDRVCNASPLIAGAARDSAYCD